jgi:hypothetical protein
MSNGNDVGAAIDAVERLCGVEALVLSETAIGVIPKGKQVVDLLPFVEARRERPRRREGTSEHTTLESFLEHVERARDSQSVIFAKDDPAGPSMVCIYDYHEAAVVAEYVDAVGDDGKPTYRTEKRDGVPRFGRHRAHYAMPFSDEWLAWAKLAGASAGWLGQLDFAQALEDRGLDVIPPNEIPASTAKAAEALAITPAGPSQLLNLSRGLLVRADRKVGSAVNLNSGEAKITFEESHTASVNDAPVMVPTGFALSIPVFRDGAAYALLVRLRYRVEGSAIKWKLAMHRSDVAFRDAFYDVAKQVKEKTGLPLFYGTPE